MRLTGNNPSISKVTGCVSIFLFHWFQEWFQATTTPLDESPEKNPSLKCFQSCIGPCRGGVRTGVVQDPAGFSKVTKEKNGKRQHMYLFICKQVYLSSTFIRLIVQNKPFLSIYLSIHLSNYLAFYLPVYLSIYLYIYPIFFHLIY